MVIAQAGLGLRIGELLGLRLQDVDFLRRTVRIDWQLTQDGKHRVDPKTPTSHRTEPLPTTIAEALAEHIRNYPPGGDGLLFTTANGNPYRQEHFGARIFKPAVKRSGLPVGTTSHDLRHHFASVLLERSLSVVAVADLLGDTPQQVLKTYGHIMPNSEDRMRRAIDDAWSSDGPQTGQVSGR